MSYRKLFKKLKKTLDSIKSSSSIISMVESIMESLVEEKSELAVTGGRLYKKSNGSYKLIAKIGESGKVKLGYEIPFDYVPIQQLIKTGYIIMKPGEPGYVRKIENPIGMKPFAAITLGENDEYIISFTLKEPFDREKIIYSLSTIKHVADLKLMHHLLESSIYEAKEIQKSLFPKGLPKFEGYDIFAKSIPAEVLSGDVYDFLHVSEMILGIAVADVSGHGLPAALQARDVIIGLRVAVEEDLKIVKTLEKLNRVIHRGSLTSKFISLFYCEIEKNGTMIYSNAGHVPPLLFSNNNIIELKAGGPILGPNPDAKYERDFAFLQKGDILIIYTDGIIETTDQNNKEYGIERMIDIIVNNKDKSSRELINTILKDVEDFRGNNPAEDDRTLVIIKRL